MESDKLERELAKLASQLTTGGRSAQGIENKYGQTYQEMVRMGYRPQLRKKYRVSKG